MDRTQARKLVNRTTDAALVPIRRRRHNPFQADDTAPALVHCPHHKVGTVWFENVMTAIGARFGLRVRRVNDVGAGPVSGDIFLHRSSKRFDRTSFGDRPIRGTHMVRDPRDVVVSGYFYHLWTDEKWARRPDPAFGGRSYQEHLNSLSQPEGLAAEIRRAAGTSLREMGTWDYEQPDFLELRYEDVLGNEPSTFQTVFRHYGFTDHAADEAAEIADGFSFRKQTGRAVGEVKRETHYRSGKPGEWRELFGQEHRALFTEETGDLLTRLGYESDESDRRDPAPGTH